MSLRDVLLVAGGGAIGAVARHAVNLLCSGLLGDRFPWGTFTVNVLGCFLLGLLLHYASVTDSISDAAKLMLGTGVLGALTTFSTFGVQTIQVWQRSPVLGVLNVAANLIVGLLAVTLGMQIANMMSANS